MAAFIVVVISPVGVLVEDRVASNIAVLQENGFLRLEQKMMELSEAEAAIVAGEAGDVQTFLSGPSMLLLMKGRASAAPSSSSSSAAAASAPSSSTTTTTSTSTTAFATLQSLKAQLDYTYHSSDTWQAVRDRQLFFPTEPVLERSFLMIKPGWTQQDYSTIVEALDAAEFVMIGKVAKILSTETATTLIGHNSKPEIDFLTSNVSVCMVVERLNAISSLILLAGPSEPQLATQLAPHSLRAKLLGSDLIHNSIYLSESSEQAASDINLMFPVPFPLERTFCLIKPDFYKTASNNNNENNSENGTNSNKNGEQLVRRSAEIIDHLVHRYEFTILASDTLTLSKARAEQFLTCHQLVSRSSPHFHPSLTHLSSGPITVLVLTKVSAVDTLRKLCGPEDPSVARHIRPNSLRARLGRDLIQNVVHCSASAEAAQREIYEFFPLLRRDHVPTLATVTHIMHSKEPPPSLSVSLSAAASTVGASGFSMNGVGGMGTPTFLSSSTLKRPSLHTTLVDGLVALCKVKPIGYEALLYLADWLERNNPNKPKLEAPPPTVTAPTLARAAGSKETGVAPPPLLAATAGDAHVSAAPSFSTTLISPSSALSSLSSPSERVIWIVGPPNSGKHTLASQLASHYRFEHVPMQQIVRGARHSHPMYGDEIELYENFGRPLPTHIVINLADYAMKTTLQTQHSNNDDDNNNKKDIHSVVKKSRGFILSSFPSNFDHAFTFESQLAPVLCVVHLQVSAMELAKRTLLKQKQVQQQQQQQQQAGTSPSAESSSGVDSNDEVSRTSVERRLRQYEEEMEPLLQHYASFRKLIEVDANGTIDQVLQQSISATRPFVKSNKMK